MYEARHVRVFRIETTVDGLQHSSSGFGQSIHLHRFRYRKWQIVLIRFSIFRHDGLGSVLALEHLWHHFIVGRSLGRNLCSRANDIVRHLAEFVDGLEAHKVAAVCEDELQMGLLLERLSQGRNIHPIA